MTLNQLRSVSGGNITAERDGYNRTAEVVFRADNKTAIVYTHARGRLFCFVRAS